MAPFHNVYEIEKKNFQEEQIEVTLGLEMQTIKNEYVVVEDLLKVLFADKIDPQKRGTMLSARSV